MARWSLLAALACAAGLVQTPTAQAAGEPVNRQAPVISQAGSTLTTTDGVWLGATRPFTYSWFRCADTDLDSCILVPGQTRPTYPITGLDAGSRIRSRVTASNQLASNSQFSAPTPAFPVAQPAPFTGPNALARLSPFPVVVVTGRYRGARTRITGLLVYGPTGAKVTLRCNSRCKVRKSAGTIPKNKRLRLRRAERLYRAGAALDIRVTGPERIGKFTRLRIRKSRAPTRADLCLRPRAVSPSSCT